MKITRLIYAAAAAVMLCGCGLLSGTPSYDVDASAEEILADALENGRLKFVVNRITPARGDSRYSTDGYNLIIEDGTVDTFLPFFGTSYSPNVYGVEPSGIEFEECPIVIDDSRSKPEKGKYVWRFSAKSGSDKVDVTLTFFSNGSADLTCAPHTRSSMSYTGKLVKLP